MPKLTDEQLAEVDRIIEETEIQINWVWDGENSLPEDSAGQTLVVAARRVREYLRSLG